MGSIIRRRSQPALRRENSRMIKQGERQHDLPFSAGIWLLALRLGHALRLTVWYCGYRRENESDRLITSGTCVIGVN